MQLASIYVNRWENTKPYQRVSKGNFTLQSVSMVLRLVFNVTDCVMRLYDGLDYCRMRKSVF